MDFQPAGTPRRTGKAVCGHYGEDTGAALRSSAHTPIIKAAAPGAYVPGAVFTELRSAGTAALIQALSQLLLTRRAVKDDEDSYETAPLMKTVILLCVAAGAAVAVAAAAVLLGAAI